MVKKILHAKIVSILSFLALGFVAAGWAWAHFALRGVANAPLILHFDDLQGITAVGDLGNFTFIGFIGTAVVLMNFFIALELDARDRMLGKLTAVITLVFAVLLFIGFAAMINVN